MKANTFCSFPFPHVKKSYGQNMSVSRPLNGVNQVNIQFVKLNYYLFPNHDSQTL